MRVEWAIADYSTTCIREDIRELRSLENLTLSNKIELHNLVSAKRLYEAWNSAKVSNYTS